MNLKPVRYSSLTGLASKNMYTLNPETLDKNRLLKAVDPEVFRLGQKLYSAGKVQILETSNKSAVCEVKDKRSYQVQFIIAQEQILLKCTCSHASRGLICEHDVATWLCLEDHYVSQSPTEWQKQISQVLDAIQSGLHVTKPDPYLLFLSLQKPSVPIFNSWTLTPYQLSPNVFPPELYQEMEISEHEASERQYGPNQELLDQLLPTSNPKITSHILDPGSCLNCTQEGVKIANLILRWYQEHSDYQYSKFPLDEYLTLTQETQIPIFFGDRDDPLQMRLKIIRNPGEVLLNLDKDETGLQISARLVFNDEVVTKDVKDFKVIHSSPTWLLTNGILSRMNNQSVVDLLKIFREDQSLFIPSHDEEKFLENYLVDLAQRIKLEGNAISWEYISSEPTPRLYLSDPNDEILVQLRYGYDEVEVKYDPVFPNESITRKPKTLTLLKIQRQPEFEKRVFEQLGSPTFSLKRAPLAAKPGYFRLRARTHPVDFLLHTLPRLKEAGYEIYGEDQLKTSRVNRNQPKISFNVSSEIDWFDIKTVVSFGDLEVRFQEIRRAMRKRERFIKLSDGSIGEIPEDWFEQYKVLFALGETTGDSLRFSRYQLSVLDQALTSADQATTDAEYKNQRERFQVLARNFKGIVPRELPQNFSGELRPYQKAGYDWLHFLHEIRFGGILADDMGLGKTIQALAFLLSLYHDPAKQHPPESASILVVPRSLLVNWQREATRFSPELRIVEYFETGRLKDPQAFNQYDLVLTTYGVMLRDIHTLHGYTFYYAILDESQAIKNPLAQTAKAAHLLQAKNHLVLTGTPIENNSSELWSQFQFLNPGMLGSQKFFKTEYVTPIEKRGDEKTVESLRQMVYPFILRRTKDQVAPELPLRTERILYSDMDPAQSKLYNRTRDYFRGILLGMLEEDGLNKSRMKVLEGLLRLRQISNHPLLIDEKFRGSSGKFDLLIETLETLRAEGHKVLVFSQFVKMLKIVCKEMDKRQIVYAYLDGKTQDRQFQVDTFQNDPSIPFFMISLKAGGLGINLTAADYVIHIDPWWNPAVEMQASDRTHRIGQEKPVFIFKLITRDTVEEKILVLQERKKSLVDQIITTERAFFKNLTSDDIELLFS